MDIELVTGPYACMMYIESPLAGLGGAHRGGLPPKLVTLAPNAASRADCFRTQEVLNFGASDSALMLTLCALQMLVLLLCGPPP